MEKRPVLVADDEPVLQVLFPRVLECAGYNVTVAHDGQEALELFRKLCSESMDVGVVVTDGRMPHINGPDLAAQIYNIDPRVRVVAITSECGKIYELFQKLANQNIHRILPKPLNDVKDLVEAVNDAYQEYDRRTTAP